MTVKSARHVCARYMKYIWEWEGLTLQRFLAAKSPTLTFYAETPKLSQVVNGMVSEGIR